MKLLLYLVASLIVIAAIIPATSAALVEDHKTGTWTCPAGYGGVHTGAHLELDPPCDPLTMNCWEGSKQVDTNYHWLASTSSTNPACTLDGTYVGRLSSASWTFRNDTVTVPSITWYNATSSGEIYAKPSEIEYLDFRTHKANIILPMNNSIPSDITKVRILITQNQPSTYFTNVNLYWGEYEESDINFVGSPLSGPAPLSVAFTATNITNTEGLSWSFGDGNVTAGGLNITHLYSNPGLYTVRLDYFNLSGVAKSVQKNDYITVGAPNATKTKYFQTIDGTNGNIVLNSSIQLKDVENSSWVNATGLINDGMSSITTLEGHTIDAYAQSLGYSDADDLDILNDGQPQYIMMWPTFAKSVSAGNVSLYVTVKDKDTKANIVGAGVTASLASGSMSTTTNEAGIAYFIVKNSSMVLITAQAIGQGYQTATTTINTGMASGGSASAAATILLGKNTVTPVFSTVVTTLPGGGTPAPVATILPGCEDTISAAGQEKCRAAQSNQGLSFLSGNLLGLIQICFVVTILYLLGIKLGK
jgi:PKD repeat protein